MKIKRLCFACDLKDEPEFIAEYKIHHANENAWHEIRGH